MVYCKTKVQQQEVSSRRPVHIQPAWRKLIYVLYVLVNQYVYWWRWGFVCDYSDFKCLVRNWTVFKQSVSVKDRDSSCNTTCCCDSEYTNMPLLHIRQDKHQLKCINLNQRCTLCSDFLDFWFLTNPCIIRRILFVVNFLFNFSSAPK